MKNIKKTIILSLAASALIALPAAARADQSTSVDTSNVQELQAELVALQSQINALRANLATAKTDVDNLPKDPSDTSTTTAVANDKDDASRAEASYSAALLDALAQTLSQMNVGTAH